MNFKTQSPPFNESNPFEHDPFDRKHFAYKLNEILRNTHGINIFIHSPWGHGKSYFLRQWKQELLNSGNTQVAVFDAFTKDHAEDPFVIFMSEIDGVISKLLEVGDESEKEEKGKKLQSKLKSALGKTMKFGAKVAASTAKQTAKKYLGDIVDELSNDAIEETVDAAGESALDLAEAHLQKRIDNLNQQHRTIQKFKQSLEESATLYKEKNNDFPLTIVIDELDRCRPDFALSLLEKMKHLFDVKGLSFVIITDKFQLGEHIAHAYGIRSDDLGYISKFGDVFCDLPSTKFLSRSGHSGYSTLVCLWGDLITGGSLNHVFRDAVIELVSAQDSSMRNVILILKKGCLKMTSVSRNDFNPVVIAMLSFMSVEYPNRIRAAINCIDRQAEHDLWVACLNAEEVDKHFNENQATISSYVNVIFGDGASQYDRTRFESLGSLAGDVESWFKSQKSMITATLRDFDSIIKLDP